jgi:hypothetical protein
VQINRYIWQLREGMGLEKGARAAEPVLARWDEGFSEEPYDANDGTEIFRLSGGVIGPAKTSNRIDGLLGKMLVNQNSGKYLGDVDKNLDFLYTSLQLDLIERVAKDFSSRADEEAPKETAIKPEEPLLLDRVRPSL